MITILNRLFPYDISQYIFEIMKNEKIKTNCITKYYCMDLLMNNIINKYTYDKNYFIFSDLIIFKQISEMHRYIMKYDNKMLDDMTVIIKIYYDVLKYHNNYQIKNIKKIIENYIN